MPPGPKKRRAKKQQQQQQQQQQPKMKKKEGEEEEEEEEEEIPLPKGEVGKVPSLQGMLHYLELFIFTFSSAMFTGYTKLLPQKLSIGKVMNIGRRLESSDFCCWF